MTDIMPKDSPMHRQLFIEMSQEQQDAWLNAVRERRLKSLRQYEALQEAKKKAKNERDLEKIDKLQARFEKQDKAVSTALEKLEKIALDIQVLRIELED